MTRPTCPHCLRPQADEADEAIWQSAESPDDIPAEWGGSDAPALCWLPYGGECQRPEWFDAVTPMDVHALRCAVYRWRGTARRMAHDARSWRGQAETDAETIEEYLRIIGAAGKVCRDQHNRIEALDSEHSKLFTELATAKHAFNAAVNARCTCGGAGPGEGCAACEVWHEYCRIRTTP